MKKLGKTFFCTKNGENTLTDYTSGTGYQLEYIFSEI
jgi:hypothetical protein